MIVTCTMYNNISTHLYCEGTQFAPIFVPKLHSTAICHTEQHSDLYKHVKWFKRYFKLISLKFEIVLITFRLWSSKLNTSVGKIAEVPMHRQLVIFMNWLNKKIISPIKFIKTIKSVDNVWIDFPKFPSTYYFCNLDPTLYYLGFVQQTFSRKYFESINYSSLDNIRTKKCLFHFSL